MKQIRTEDAVGHVLCHDMTQIIPGKYKGPVFKKGHIVTEEDIPVLLSIGKEHLYVWEKTDGMLHEDEAAQILRDLAIGPHMTASEPSEGKIELKAACDGLFKVNRKALLAINSTPQMMIATRFGDTPVKAGDKLAGTRIIPLVIEKEKMDDLVRRTREVTEGESVLALKPFVHKKVGIVTTGSEVSKGRIEDTFTPVLIRKLEVFDTELIGHEVTDDDDRKRPGRPHAACHPEYGRFHRHLWRAGAPGSHVPALLSAKRVPGRSGSRDLRSPGLCDVRKAHDL